jgi:hypothetical protein
MAKAKSQAAQGQQARPRPRAAQRVDPERINRLLILGGVIAVILLAFGVIGYGWYATQIKPLSKTVLRVGDTKFSLGHLERRMELTRSNSPGVYVGDQLIQLPDATLNTLEFEALLLETADQLDIAVTDEELDVEIRDRASLAEDSQPSLVAQAFRRQVDDSGLKPNEYRQMLRAELLRQEVLNYFVFLSPTAETQVRARWIITETKEDADAALAKVNAGDDFAAVANTVSIQATASQDGGLIDWGPRGTYPVEKIETYLFDDAQPGEHSDVIVTDQFFYIVQLLDRQEDRTLDESQRNLVSNREMTKWLDAAQKKLTVVRNFTEQDAVRAINDIL